MAGQRQDEASFAAARAVSGRRVEMDKSPFPSPRRAAAAIRFAVALLLAAAPLCAAPIGRQRAAADRLGLGIASAALCQPQIGPRQSARGAEQGASDALGVRARRPSCGNHRRVRDLAENSRFRGNRRLGVCIRCCPAAEPRSSRPGRRSQFSPTPATKRRRWRSSPPASSPACAAATGPGAASPARASTPM